MYHKRLKLVNISLANMEQSWGSSYVRRDRLGTILCTITYKIYCAMDVRVLPDDSISRQCHGPPDKQPQIQIHLNLLLSIANQRKTSASL